MFTRRGRSRVPVRTSPWPECPPKSAMTNRRRGTPASGLGPCLFDFPKRKSISIPARFSSPMVYLGHAGQLACSPVAGGAGG